MDGQHLLEVSANGCVSAEPPALHGSSAASTNIGSGIFMWACPFWGLCLLQKGCKKKVYFIAADGFLQTVIGDTLHRSLFPDIIRRDVLLANVKGSRPPNPETCKHSGTCIVADAHISVVHAPS